MVQALPGVDLIPSGGAGCGDVEVSRRVRRSARMGKWEQTNSPERYRKTWDAVNRSESKSQATANTTTCGIKIR